MITKIKKTIVIDKWLDEDLSKYLEKHLLENVPPHGTNFNDKLSCFLIYKLEKTLNMKAGKFIIYFNVYDPWHTEDFHKDDVGTISCIYMVTKTSTPYFEIQCQPYAYCKIPFVQNRLVAFDSNLLYKGRGAQDTTRITIAFKTRINEKK